MSEQISNGEPEFAAFVGIDWADRQHVWALQEAGHSKRETGTVDNTPEAVEAWAVQLGVRFAGRPVAIALEQSRGALVWLLSKYQHVVLYPIHPATSSRYRSAMCPSGSKNDPLDTDLLLDIVILHRDRLRALQPDTEQTRKLQRLVEKRRELVGDVTANTNRVTELLKEYFPQMLNWVDDIGSPLAFAFLERWPTLAQVQKEEPETVRNFYWKHGCRSQAAIEIRLQQMRTAVVATVDAAVVQPAVLVVRTLLAAVAALRTGIANLERAIEDTTATHPDAEIFASFPAAGPVMLPRLIAAFGSRRERYESANQVQSFSGIAPVISRSGNRKWVHVRWACPKFLRQTFHEYAGLSIQRCAWAREFYEQQRARGKHHHAAVRALAFKWIRILFRCWKSRAPYNEALYMNSCASRRSAALADPAAGRAKAVTAAKAPAQSKVAAKAACAPVVEMQFKTVAGMAKFCGSPS